MSADVEGGVVKYFFLEHLLGLLFSHFPFHEVEGRVGLFHLNGSRLSFLFVEDGAEVTVLPIVLAAVHIYLYLY